jgi:hypothetical protein
LVSLACVLSISPYLSLSLPPSPLSLTFSLALFLSLPPPSPPPPQLVLVGFGGRASEWDEPQLLLFEVTEPQSFDADQDPNTLNLHSMRARTRARV